MTIFSHSEHRPSTSDTMIRTSPLLPSSVTIYDQQFRHLKEMERRFLLCCQQINLVDQKLDALQVRYIRANRDEHRSVRYSLRLQIATVEGVRNIFYQYAKVKGAEIARIRRGLFNEDVDVHDYVEIPDSEL